MKKSELQVLVSTMGQSDNRLCERMNLNSDAIIINQNDSVGYTKYRHNNFDVHFYTFSERGVGQSRNEALMRSSADIICMADDDMIYTDTYREDMLAEFEQHPEADAIIFNVESVNGSRETERIKVYQRVGKRKSREFSTVNIAVRREKLLLKNISFNTMFGPGSESGFSCGEDTLFLKEMIDKGLRVYQSPVQIAQVDMSESSWFTGYNEKYFHDKGALIGAAYPGISNMLVLLQAFRNSKKKLGSYKYFGSVYRWYASGLKDYKNRIR